MKKFIYTDDDLLKFLLGQIKAIQVDAEESSTDKIVSATIIYKNGSETDCRLPRNLIDYLSDRIHDLFKKDEPIATDIYSFLHFKEENMAPSNKCSDANGNEDVNDSECQDSCADSMCCDCAEQTYSSKEYYELKKECIEKDHEITLLKRKVEVLEYLIYNCIPKDDRRAD